MSLHRKFYDNYIWSLKYRPNSIDNIVLPEKTKNIFKEMIVKNEVPNMLFYGCAGVGKTTVASVIADTLGRECIYINGSLETSIDVLRGKITQFVTSVSFNGDKKIVIVDEAERLSINASDAMKAFLEEFSKNASFIFITNNLHKIIDPLISRLTTVEFVFNQTELNGMRKQFAKIVLSILDNETIQYDKRILAHIINNNFPDMRKTLNTLQKYKDSLCDVSILDKENNDVVKWFEIVQQKDFSKIKSYCANITDSQMFFTNVYDNLIKCVDKSDISAMIVLTSEYAYKSSFVKDQRIILVAYSCEVMKNIKLLEV